MLNENNRPFGVIHVIPTTFQNPADYMSMCDWMKTSKKPLPNELTRHTFCCKMFPNVDGIWYSTDYGLENDEVLTLFDNGCVELKQNFTTQSKNKKKYITNLDYFFSAIDDIIKGTAEIYRSTDRHSAVYVCISVIGCKGCWYSDSSAIYHSLPSMVDRDMILCVPIEIKDILDAENVAIVISECKKRTRYALGINREEL